MAKREVNIEKRSRFCKLAMNSPEKAAAELRDLATGLENCRNVSDTINALCEIYAVSERTVFRGLID